MVARCLRLAGAGAMGGHAVLVDAGAAGGPRVLAPNEKPLSASKLMLKRLGDDPTSRAWLTTIT